jgi:O-acetyl-ADP-ribose deacetylase (regulator of RNase III)
MKLHLIDVNQTLVQAWRTEFAEFPEVDIQHGDILRVAHHCIVSPANSHGFMDGGIDDQYRRFFGPEIEQVVQRAILNRPEQLLPVGASLVVQTGHPRISWLIVAPTMEMPEAVPAHHSGRALRAVLRLVDRHRELDGDIFCPGLGTLTGRVPVEFAAKEMATAYKAWLHDRSEAVDSNHSVL